MEKYQSSTPKEWSVIVQKLVGYHDWEEDYKKGGDELNRFPSDDCNKVSCESHFLNISKRVRFEKL